MFAQLVQAFSRMSEAHFPVRPLTLTPGQVVMGEIVRQLDDREVVVRIANQLLRAITEVPLTTQKHHWFQVQPDPANLVLKVVTGRKPSQHNQPVLPTPAALLENWGLKATRQHVQAIEWLMQQNLPLTRQSVEQLIAVWQNVGRSAATDQAVLLTFSKHLPLTASIVSAIQQFVSGQSLTGQLTQLAEQLNQWLRLDGKIDTGTRAHVEAVLKQIGNLLHSPAGRPEASVPYSARTVPGLASQTAPVALPAMSATTAQAGQAVVTQQDGSVRVSASAIPTNSTPLPGAHVTHTGQAPPQTASSAQQVFNQLSPNSIPHSASAHGSIPSSDTHPVGTTRSEARGLTATFIHKWLQTLGIEREGNLSRLIRTATSAPQSMPVHPAEGAAANVKEGLMRLLQFSIPSAVREAAEITVQHITGQQLLLSTTNETNWQHLLINIPLGLSQEQEASLHVFTRKNGDGKLDKDNCRLLLQLELERLGSNCLLVQIVNRAVHIEWYCDDAHLPEQINAYEPKLREQLESIGYHLSGVTVKPMSQQAEKVDRVMWPLAANSESGVDIRI